MAHVTRHQLTANSGVRYFLGYVWWDAGKSIPIYGRVFCKQPNGFTDGKGGLGSFLMSAHWHPTSIACDNRESSFAVTITYFSLGIREWSMN